MLGNGGSTAFWDAAACGLIRRRALHLVCGEFSQKFATVTKAAPFLDDPIVVSSDPGDAPAPVSDPDADVITWAHNETSTGVMSDVRRPADSEHALVLIDATSGAGGLPVDVSQSDVYYFAPQKSFGSDGGLWLAAGQPRGASSGSANSTAPTDRWIAELAVAGDGAGQLPAGPDVQHPGPGDAAVARRPDRLDARRRRPRLLRRPDAGVVRAPLRLGRGVGVRHAVRRPTRRKRSLVVGTIDFADGVDAAAIAKTLRANGIVDVEPYRKLGRNQLRVGMFPAVEPG